MGIPKKVLGIVGSPRSGGNTEIMVDAILEGAQSVGAVIEKVHLRNQTLQPCQACDGCVNTRHCIIDDDLSVLREKLIQNDVWVFGTPVYYSGPTAQFKAFMDRWYSIDQSYFKGKTVILAVPLGDDRSEMARHTVGMLEDALEFQGTGLAATLIAPNVFELGTVRNFPEVLEKARRIGEESLEKTND